jgi:hypothetical protein
VVELVGGIVTDGEQVLLFQEGFSGSRNVGSEQQSRAETAKKG